MAEEQLPDWTDELPGTDRQGLTALQPAVDQVTSLLMPGGGEPEPEAAAPEVPQVETRRPTAAEVRLLSGLDARDRPIESALDEFDQEKRRAELNRTAITLRLAGAATPEDIRLADESGLPVETVRRIGIRKDEAAVLEKAPVLAQFLQDPRKAQLLKSDLYRMSWLERMTTYIGKKWDANWLQHGPVEQLGIQLMMDDMGNATVDDGPRSVSPRVPASTQKVPGSPRRMMTPEEREKASAEYRAMTQRISRDNDEVYEGSNWFELTAIEGIGQIPQQMMAIDDRVEWGVKAGLAAGAAGFVAGGPVGAGIGLRKGAQIGFGHLGMGMASFHFERQAAYHGYADLRDEDGNPLDKSTRFGLATIAGALSAGLELAGTEAVIHRVGGKVGSKIGQLLRRGPREAVRALLASPTYRGVLLDWARTAGTAALAEGATEVAQAMVVDVFGAIGEGKDLPEMLDMLIQKAPEYAREGVSGSAGGAGASVAVGSIGAAVDYHEVKQARQREQAFLALGKIASGSTSVRDAPNTAQEALQRVSDKGGGLAAVFIDVDQWDKYWQSQDASARDVAAHVMGDDGTAYDQARESGGQIAVPTAAYAVKLAPTKHHESLAEELRAAPRAMNGREARAWMKTTLETTEAPAPVEANDPVYQGLLARLEAAGYQGTAAESQAQFVASRINRFAKVMARDPMEVLEQYDWGVVRPDLDEMAEPGEGTDVLANQPARLSGLMTEIRDLQPRVQAAYESGRLDEAEQLDAELDEKMTAAESMLEALDEDEAGPDEVVGPPSAEELLAEMHTRRGDFATDAEFAAAVRNELTQATFPALADVDDVTAISAARDAFASHQALRARQVQGRAERHIASRRISGLATAGDSEKPVFSAETMADVNAHFDRDESFDQDPIGDVTAFTRVGGKAGGINAGYQAQDAAGKQWLFKMVTNDDAARAEVLASKLFAAAGVAVPQIELVTSTERYDANGRTRSSMEKKLDAAKTKARVYEAMLASPDTLPGAAERMLKRRNLLEDWLKKDVQDLQALVDNFVEDHREDRLYVASRWLHGIDIGDRNGDQRYTDYYIAGFLDHVLVDMWLGNGDVQTGGNVAMVKGQVVRVDLGATLFYDAAGGVRPERFLPTDAQYDEYTSPSSDMAPFIDPPEGGVDSGLTAGHLRKGVEALKRVTDEVIDKLIANSDLSDTFASELDVSTRVLGRPRMGVAPLPPLPNPSQMGPAPWRAAIAARKAQKPSTKTFLANTLKARRDALIERAEKETAGLADAEVVAGGGAPSRYNQGPRDSGVDSFDQGPARDAVAAIRAGNNPYAADAADATARLGRKAKRAGKTPPIGIVVNPRKVLRAKGLPNFVVGPPTADDWIARVGTVLKTPEEIFTASQWYEDLVQVFVDAFGDGDGQLILAAWLAANIQASPQVALMNVLRARESTLTGVQGMKAGLNDEALRRLFAGQGVEKGIGQKLFDFVDSALGRATRTYYGDDPAGGAPAVIDVHSWRDMGAVDGPLLRRLQKLGYSTKGVKLDIEEGAPTETQYEWAADHLRELTADLNRRKWLGRSDWLPRQIQAIGWMTIATLTGAEGGTAPEAIAYNTRRMAFEAEPGAGTDLPVDAFRALPQERRQAITNALGARVSDALATMFGIIPKGLTYGTGRWESGPETPSVVAEVFATPEGAEAYANAIGLLLSQTAVWVATPKASTKNPNHLGILVTGRGIETDEGLAEAWDKLRAASPDIKGYQPYEDADGRRGILVLLPNTTRRKADAVEAAIAEIEWPWSEQVDVRTGEYAITMAGDNRNEGAQFSAEGYHARLRELGFGHLRGVLDNLRQEFADEFRAAVAGADTAGTEGAGETFQQEGREAPGQVREGEGNYGVEDPGSLAPEQRKAHFAARRAAAALAVSRVARGFSVLGNAVASDFRSQGVASLLGRRIRNAADLARLGEILRDPRYETFRYHFVDADGKVVHETALSSRMPGATGIVPKTADPDQFIQTLFIEAKAAGATGYWLTHNHPSGDPTPSGADIAVTKILAAATYLAFRGHVVVDSDRYATIDADGNQEIVEKKHRKRAYGTSPLIPHTLLGSPVSSPAQLVSIAAELNASSRGRVVVIGFGGVEGRTKLLAEMDVAVLRNPGRAAAALRSMARASGSTRIGLAGVQQADAASAIRVADMVGDNWVVDVVLIDGVSLAAAGVYLPFGQKRRAITAVKAPDESTYEYAPGAKFATWFGDSVVVDSQGRPLRVYHGTLAEDIDAFDNEDVANNDIDAGVGTFFAARASEAGWFTQEETDLLGSRSDKFSGGANILPVFLAIRNPKRFETQKEYRAYVDEHAPYHRDGNGVGLRLALEAEGHDGIVIEDSQFDRGEGGAWYIAFRPEQIKSAVGNRGTFDPDSPSILEQKKGDKPRGRIFIERATGKLRILLFAGADLSTFIHEAGHGFLKMMQDGVDYLLTLDTLTPEQEQFLKDAETIEKWLGTPLNKVTAKEHEKFADGALVYTREGKAPSVSLARAFHRFRSWLLALYPVVEELGVQLNDEVRDAYARMFASDAEIAEARKQNHLEALFTTAEQAGMSPAQFALYRQTMEDAHREAVEQVEQKLFKQLLRTREKWWKEELARAQTDAEDELLREKPYAAQRAMMGKDGVKIDRALVEALVGKEQANKIATLIRRADALTPDQGAELFGYTSGADLVNALVNLKPLQKAAQDIAEQRMRETHGDLYADAGALADEAEQAVLGEKRFEVVRRELEALAELQRTVEPFARAERKDQRQGLALLRSVPGIDVLRKVAERQIAGLAIRDIRPDTYIASARKASRGALEAVAKKSWAEAARLKQQELLNLELYKQARKAKDEVDKGLAFVRRLDRGPAMKRFAQTGYVAQLQRLMEHYEFATVSLRALDRRQSLKAWIESQEEQGLPVQLPQSVIDGLAEGQRNYRELPMEEFRGVIEALRQINHLSKLKAKLMAARDKREFEAVVDEIVTGIEANAPERAREIETGLPQEALGEWWKSYRTRHRRMSSLARQMDGSKEGPVWEHLIRALNVAADDEVERKVAAMAKLAELFKPYTSSRFHRLGGVKSLFGFAPEMFQTDVFPQLRTDKFRSGKLSHAGRLMMALNWGNEGNRQRLKDGYGWSDQQVNSILNTLTADDWKFVQGVWDFFEEYWPETRALAERMDGVPPAKVDPAPFDTPHGRMRGGYFPAKYDPAKSSGGFWMSVEDAAKEAMQGLRVRASTKHGQREQRAKEVKGRPLLLDFSVIYGHVEDVIHDITHFGALTDANRILRNDRVREAILSRYGPETYKEMTDAVRDIAAGDVPARDGWERAVNWLRTGSTIVGMGLNVSTAAIQLTGLSQSVVRIGAPAMWRGLKATFGRNPNKAAEEVEAKSSFMRNRARTQLREIAEIRNKVQGEVIETHWYFWMIAQMQRAVDVPTWLGAHDKAMSEGNDDARSIAIADQAVRDSQGSGLTGDLAGVQRGSPLHKLWTNFYSYMNVTLNLTAESYARTDFVKPKSVGLFLADMLMLYTVPAVLGTIIRDLLVPDDDEEDDEDYLAKLALAQISFAAGTMLGMRELSSAIQGYYGYSGPAGTRFFSEAGKLWGQAAQGELDMPFLKSLNTTTGVLFHYPAGQVSRTVEGIVALAEDRTDNPLAILFGPPK